jgi:hypothetical protein
VAAVVALLLVACSGSDKAKQASSSSTSSSSASSSGSLDTSASSDETTTTTTPAKPSQALCDAFAADVQRRVANAQVDIATLTVAQLQERLDAGTASLQAMVAAADGVVRAGLEDELAIRTAGAAALVAAWGDTGAALAQQAQAQGKHSIEAFVLADGIDVPGGKIVTLGALGRVSQRNLGRLVVGCQDQALGVRADDREPKPSGGAILYTATAATGAAPDLAVVGVGGSDPQTLPPSAGGRTEAAVSADGRVAFVTAAPNGTTLALAPSLDALAQAADVGIAGRCPTFSADGSKLVTTVLDAPGANGVYVIDAGGAPQPVALPFPATDAGCAAFADDATLIVGRTVFDGGFELWRVPLGGGGTMLVARHDCVGMLGSVTADGKTAAVGVTCADVRSGGLHLFDLANGRDTLLQAGLVNAPRFSGDGRWLAYSFAPFGADPDTDLLITISGVDGTGEHAVLPTPGIWPAWLPVGASAEGNPRV